MMNEDDIPEITFDEVMDTLREAHRNFEQDYNAPHPRKNFNSPEVKALVKAYLLMNATSWDRASYTWANIEWNGLLSWVPPIVIEPGEDLTLTEVMDSLMKAKRNGEQRYMIPLRGSLSTLEKFDVVVKDFLDVRTHGFDVLKSNPPYYIHLEWKYGCHR